MARGWESKSIEEQQAAASTPKEKHTALAAEQIAARQRRQSLHLSRQRVLQQLQMACNPRHRQMLEAALADLEAEIKRSE